MDYQKMMQNPPQNGAPPPKGPFLGVLARAASPIDFCQIYSLDERTLGGRPLCLGPHTEQYMFYLI